MTRKRSHNVRVRLLTGKGRFGNRYKTRNRNCSKNSKRIRNRAPKAAVRRKELRTRIDAEQAAVLLANYRVLFMDRVFSLGDSVNHPRHGRAAIVGIEIRGSGGWHKVDYVLRTEKGSIRRMRLQDAASRGLRTSE